MSGQILWVNNEVQRDLSSFFLMGWVSPKLLNLTSSILSARSSVVLIILGLFGPLYEAYGPFLASFLNPCVK